MKYTDLIKDLEKKMRKTFGMIRKEDLSGYEVSVYNSVVADMKGVKPEVYIADLDDKIDVNLKKQNDLWAVFESLASNNDNEAIKLYREYNASREEQERFENLYIANHNEEEAAEKENKKLVTEHDAALKAYNKKVTEIEKKYKDAVATAMEKFAGKVVKPEQSLQKKYPELTKLAEELEPLESFIQQTDKSLEDALAEQKTKAEDSKEYNECEEVIEFLLDKKAEYRKTAAPLRARYNELKAKIADKNQILAKQDADYEKKIKKLDDEKAASLAKALSKYQPKKDALDANVSKMNDLSAKGDKLFRDKRMQEENTDRCKQACMNHAASILTAEFAILKEKKLQYEKFDAIREALKPHKPDIKIWMFAKELADVNQAYMIYHNKYSGFQRFFRWVPFTDVHKDYDAFSSLRSQFVNATGIRKSELNTYLDENTMSEILKTDTKGMEITKANIETKVDKNYGRMDGVKPEEYAARISYLSSHCLFQGMAAFGKTLVKVDEGLKMLNALGDEKRLNPECKAIDDAIQEVSKGCRMYSMIGAYQKDINDRISNALLPESERKEMPVHFLTPQEEQAYKISKDAESIEKNNEINAVLLTDNGGYVPACNPEPAVIRLADKPKDAERKQLEVEDEPKNAEKNNALDKDNGKALEMDNELNMK